MLSKCKEQPKCSVCPYCDNCRIRQSFYSSLDGFYNMFNILSSNITTASKMLGRSNEETELMVNELLTELMHKRSIELDKTSSKNNG